MLGTIPNTCRNLIEFMNPNDSAFPWQVTCVAGQTNPVTEKVVPEGIEEIAGHTGLTIRQYYAAMAMQGVINTSIEVAKAGLAISPTQIAYQAFEIADAMIAQEGKGI